MVRGFKTKPLRPFLPGEPHGQPGLKVPVIVLRLCYPFLVNKRNPAPNGPTRKGTDAMDWEIRYVGGHVEVYTLSGSFLFSADTAREAMEELAV